MGCKQMGKSLVLIGLIFVIVGGVFCFFEMRGLKIFPLPGDIIIRGEKGVFFSPCFLYCYQHCIKPFVKIVKIGDG
ncbi:MAG: DUF2905 family protein [Peptococcus niger]